MRERTNTDRINFLNRFKPLVFWGSNETECCLVTPTITFRGPSLQEVVDQGLERLEKHEAELEEALAKYEVR